MTQSVFMRPESTPRSISPCRLKVERAPEGAASHPFQHDKSGIECWRNDMQIVPTTFRLDLNAIMNVSGQNTRLSARLHIQNRDDDGATKFCIPRRLIAHAQIK